MTAPLVSTLGDVLTLPALYLATGLLGIGLVTSGLGWVLAAVGRRRRWWPGPVLAPAAAAHRAVVDPGARGGRRLVSSLAGVALERRLGTFSRATRRCSSSCPRTSPAPARSAGSCPGGSPASSSSASPRRPRCRRAPPAATSGSWPASACPSSSPTAPAPTSWPALLGEASPGLGHLIAASLLGGAAAMLVVLVIAYYGTIATVRLGIDPDTYGIPMVSSTVDLVGALTLIVAIATLGLT